MALVVKPESIDEMVNAFYDAQSTRDKTPPIGEIDTLTSISITHGRLMIVGEQFPTDFIIRSYDLKPKEECNENTEKLARIVARLVDADHLYLAINDAMKRDGFVMEIIGDKVIVNELKASVGETDEQPQGKLSSAVFVEHPPEVDGE